MDPRELIRLAQADELAGQLDDAAGKLRRAAVMYRAQGKEARAEQLERHVDRLLTSPATPVHPERRSAGAESKGQNSPSALSGPASNGGDLFSRRGPSRADDSRETWCSFCCRPDREVGALIASPSATSAFICASCLREGAAMLAGEPASAVAAALHGPASAEERSAAGGRELSLCGGEPESYEQLTHPPRPSPRGPELALCGGEEESLADLKAPASELVACGGEVESFAQFTGAPVPAVAPRARVQVREVDSGLLDGQGRTRVELERAIVQGAHRILLLGPDGAGASTLLRALAESNAGDLATARAVLEGAKSARRWLIDGISALSVAEREKLAVLLAGHDYVLVARGELPRANLELKMGDQRAPLHSTTELRLATSSQLPLSLVEQIDATVCLPALTDADLRAIAQRTLARLGRHALPPVIDQVIAEARRSGRGAHELVAMLRRLPPGAWSLAPGPEGSAG